MVLLPEMPFALLTNDELLDYQTYNHVLEADDYPEVLTVEERNRQEFIEGLENIKTISKDAFIILLGLALVGTSMHYSLTSNLSERTISCLAGTAITGLVSFVAVKCFKTS